MTASHDSTGHPAWRASLLWLALAALPMAAVADGAADTTPAASPEMAPAPALTQLQAQITSLESEHGAYSPVLPEQLLSLGLALQDTGQHREAAATLRRGAHLARISSGLYTQAQLPLLEAEIRSLRALSHYPEVDERQTWLHRVQLRSLAPGIQRAMALVSHADWQREAYLHGIDEEPVHRLPQMWELNRQALNEVLAAEGDRSPSLLLPLRGMLQAQYLIADLQWQGGPGLYDGYRIVERGPGDQRPTGYRRESFRQGVALLEAMRELWLGQTGPDSVESARALVMLGDWQQWHGEHQQALASYRQAIAELARNGTAQARREMDELFSAPVPLPDLAGVDQFAPVPRRPEGDILLEFAISAEGKVVELARRDASGQASGVAHRLMRKLRRTPFRPRFDAEAGQPVATDKMLWAYDSKQW